MEYDDDQPKLNHVRLVLFDFDYTLADSSKGAVQCINFALNGLGLSQVSEDRIRKTIGLSLRQTFLTLTSADTANRADEFVQLFVRRADEVMADLTYLFDEAPDTIMRLRERGFSLGIVSTKFRYRIAEILRRHELGTAFDVIIGGEDVIAHKPDPEGIIKAVSQTDCRLGNTAYVGDSLVDAETARRAGVRFIAVLTGTTPREDFAGHEVYGVLANLRELPPFLALSESRMS
jgi:phosphoglycolate phosphatase